ncbi:MULTISPECIES: YrhC family protein [Bacillaceae]|uniref:Uncharacterized protein n=1 Tax=Alkalicoccobacillus plakortidis TaxID=444060 RepID=A0A9D5DL48_9BACI|nr:MULTISPECIES: YrhC family protein [Bacillaceae]KQL55930.1 hypothetical protein AN965_16770 [Alkalicoccobacillus plakortidis]
MDQRDKLVYAKKDYHAFCLVFLGIGFFLTVGLWLPEPYRIETTLALAVIVGACLVFSSGCFVFSWLANMRLQRLNNKE